MASLPEENGGSGGEGVVGTVGYGGGCSASMIVPGGTDGGIGGGTGGGGGFVFIAGRL